MGRIVKFRKPRRARRRLSRVEQALLLGLAGFGLLCFDPYRDGVGLWRGASAATAATATAAAGGGLSSARIVDGDTFWFEGDKIRIADIDAPEMRGRCAYESDLARQATRRMADLLDEGPFDLAPITGRDEDRYGRKVRIVTRHGRSLGDQLVAEGLARTWTGRREPWC